MSLQEYIQSYQVFSAEEIPKVLALFECRHFKKFEYLVREGEVCDEIVFIGSGIFHGYYTLDAEDITYNLAYPETMIAAYASFITGEVSTESIQAIMPAKVWILKKHKIEQLVNQELSWSRFFKILSDNQYVDMERRIFYMRTHTAKERYEFVLEQCPECVQITPLKYLAPFLGVTPRHLSRIRKEIATL